MSKEIRIQTPSPQLAEPQSIAPQGAEPPGASPLIGSQQSALPSALTTFCSHLSQGLHAVAQPLSILRASLSFDQLNQMSPGELRELAGDLSAEVERVCAMFNSMQQLVHTEAAAPHLLAASLLSLLESSIEDVSLLFVDNGITLATKFPAECASVLIDSARTRRAVSTILMLAHEVSHTADSVEFIVTSRPGAIHLTIRNCNADVSCMSGEFKLAMALAEASIRTQQAGFSWHSAPFTVEIELPKAPALDYC